MSDTEIIFVTAFKDINRDKWEHYSLSARRYIDYFYTLSDNISYKLIVYLEDNIKHIVIKNKQFRENIIFEDFNKVNTFFNNFIEDDIKIISSKEYKDKIPYNRKHLPEHLYSEYNLINHSKINFISHTKKLYPNYLFYAWIDFGRMNESLNNIPRDIDINLIPKNKISYHCVNEPPLNKITSNDMLKSNFVFFLGSSFIVPNNLVDLFELLWRKKIIEWQKNNITDDDQNLVLQIYFDNIDLFNKIKYDKWYGMYNTLINKNTIFVQIASYRDPELLSTIKDCLNKAKHPELLSFGICWQHANEDTWDTLEDYINNPQFTIMDVPWNESKGACWARHNIQNMWKGEKYTLQLDSHHRFIKNWDEQLIEMMDLTESNKPIITSYAAPYNPIDNKLITHEPYHMVGKFSGDVILFTPAIIPNYKTLKKPVPARFVSGHYYFTLGKHCEDCKYDPDLYFTGEEISLSVRSFTMGYDLFHPHQTIIWHEYSRSGRTKHWDDFDNKNKNSGIVKQVWSDIDYKSKNRVRVLLNQLDDTSIDLGKYKLGTERTLEDYELYAGINFKKSMMHHEAALGKYPPINDFNYNWEDSITEHKLTLNLPYIDMIDIGFICVCVESENNTNLFRTDLTKYEKTLNIVFKTHLKPEKWIFWPSYKSSGWGEKKTFIL